MPNAKRLNHYSTRAAEGAQWQTQRSRTAGHKKPAKTNGHAMVTPEERHKLIAAAAYQRAERRGFVGGDPLDDWLAAEAWIDCTLAPLDS